jgi:hypothetical protein
MWCPKNESKRPEVVMARTVEATTVAGIDMGTQSIKAVFYDVYTRRKSGLG